MRCLRRFPIASGSNSPPEDPEMPSGIPPSFHFKSSRLGSIGSNLFKQGFSEKSVDIMLKQHKVGTVSQYQSAWTKFIKFLDEENIPHDKVVLCTVLFFLSAQLAKHDWAYNTIAGYRCALIHPLWYSLNLNLEVKQSDSFMKGLYATKPTPRTTRFPLWALSGFLILKKGSL